MKQLFGQAVFSVEHRTYCWEDVLLAARMWGEWDAVEARTRDGLARSRRYGEEVDERELAARAARFRYDRDLISGDETKSWLARWGLTVKGWKHYLRWTLLREKAPAAPDVSVDPGEIADCVAYEAVCSGDLARFARKLAGRVAVVAREDAGAVGIDATNKSEHLAHVERRYEAQLDEILSPAAVAEQLRVHYFDWIRLDCEATSLPTRDIAREVALGVREDGMAFADAAAEAGAAVRRSARYLDEIPPALQTALVAASPGELVGPVLFDDEYYLVRLREKIVPSAEDPETAARAEVAALAAALERETDNRVRWHWQL